MNSIEEVRDYLIADEISRIQSLSREELERELITLQSQSLENLSEEEILQKIWNHEN